MLEPDNGSQVVVYCDPESDDGHELVLRFRRDDDVPRDCTPVSAITGYDIDSARWVCLEGVWDHPLAWGGLPMIPGFRRVEMT